MHLFNFIQIWNCQFHHVHFMRIKMCTFKVWQVNSFANGISRNKNIHFLITILHYDILQQKFDNKISIYLISHERKGCRFRQQYHKLFWHYISAIQTFVKWMYKWRVTTNACLFWFWTFVNSLESLLHLIKKTISRPPDIKTTSMFSIF